MGEEQKTAREREKRTKRKKGRGGDETKSDEMK